MRTKHLLLFVGLMTAPLTASAQNIKNIPLPASQNPTNAVLPISAAVWAGNTLYVSGWLDPDMKTDTDTKSQTIGMFADIKKLLESQHLTLGDVAMVRMYLGNNPATDGKPDTGPMNAAYAQFFGTTDQPNKPARTTVQVVLPAASRGALVEVDLIAVRPM
jgi:enamine deaminase RidA (YjgF/YER057c/UK114 family)